MKNDGFRRDIKKFIAKSEKALDQYVQKVVLSVDARLVQKSPVDTGRLKNNWNISPSSPDLSTTDAVAPNLTQSKSASVVYKIRANGQVIYITNALPYAWRIEYEGYSKIKAPQGMVRVTLAEMSNILLDSAYEVKRLV